MTIWEDPSGALQSYIAAIYTFLSTITQSNVWTTCMAVLAAIVLVIRAYKEVRGLIGTKTDKKSKE